MKVRFFRDTDGWWYEVTGIQSQYGARYAEGPFMFKFMARMRYKREFL